MDERSVDKAAAVEPENSPSRGRSITPSVNRDISRGSIGRHRSSSASEGEGRGSPSSGQRSPDRRSTSPSQHGNHDFPNEGDNYEDHDLVGSLSDFDAAGQEGSVDAADSLDREVDGEDSAGSEEHSPHDLADSADGPSAEVRSPRDGADTADGPSAEVRSHRDGADTADGPSAEERPRDGADTGADARVEDRSPRPVSADCTGPSAAMPHPAVAASPTAAAGPAGDLRTPSLKAGARDEPRCQPAGSSGQRSRSPHHPPPGRKRSRSRDRDLGHGRIRSHSPAGRRIPNPVRRESGGGSGGSGSVRWQMHGGAAGGRPAATAPALSPPGCRSGGRAGRRLPPYDRPIQDPLWDEYGGRGPEARRGSYGPLDGGPPGAYWPPGPVFSGHRAPLPPSPPRSMRGLTHRSRSPSPGPGPGPGPGLRAMPPSRNPPDHYRHRSPHQQHHLQRDAPPGRDLRYGQGGRGGGDSGGVYALQGPPRRPSPSSPQPPRHPRHEPPPWIDAIRGPVGGRGDPRVGGGAVPGWGRQPPSPGGPDMSYGERGPAGGAEERRGWDPGRGPGRGVYDRHGGSAADDMRGGPGPSGLPAPYHPGWDRGGGGGGASGLPPVLGGPAGRPGGSHPHSRPPHLQGPMFGRAPPSPPRSHRGRANGGGGGCPGQYGNGPPSPPPLRRSPQHRRQSDGGGELGPRGSMANPYGVLGSRGGLEGRLGAPPQPPPPAATNTAAGSRYGGRRSPSPPPYRRYGDGDAPGNRYDAIRQYPGPASPRRPRALQSPDRRRPDPEPHTRYDMGVSPPHDPGFRGRPWSPPPGPLYGLQGDRHGASEARGWMGRSSARASPPLARRPPHWAADPREGGPPRSQHSSPHRFPTLGGAALDFPAAVAAPTPRRAPTQVSRDSYDQRRPPGGNGEPHLHEREPCDGAGPSYSRRPLSPRGFDDPLPPAKRRPPPELSGRGQSLGYHGHRGAVFEPDKAPEHGGSLPRPAPPGFGPPGRHDPADPPGGVRNGWSRAAAGTGRDVRRVRIPSPFGGSRGGRSPQRRGHDDSKMNHVSQHGPPPPSNATSTQRSADGGAGAMDGIEPGGSAASTGAAWSGPSHRADATAGTANAGAAAAAGVPQALYRNQPVFGGGGGGSSVPATASAAFVPLASYDDAAEVWFYTDPSGRQQGPCSIVQFRSWLRYLAQDASFRIEYDKFRSCAVWRQPLVTADWHTTGGGGVGGVTQTTLSELVHDVLE